MIATLQDLVKQLLSVTTLTTTSQTKLGAIQTHLITDAATDFNTYVNPLNVAAFLDKMMSATLAQGIAAYVGGQLATASATGAFGDVLNGVFKDATCTYQAVQLSDTGPMQFACGTIAGQGSGRASVNTLSPALGSIVPEFYAIPGFGPLQDYTDPVLGAMTARVRYNKLYTFLTNGAINPAVYTTFNAAVAGSGDRLQKILKDTKKLLPGAQGNAIANVIFLTQAATVCASTLQMAAAGAMPASQSRGICGALTMDMGSLKETDAIALATYLVDTIGAGAMTVQITQGNGGPYVRANASNLIVDGYISNVITYLRPYLPASLGIPDSPAGPSLIENSRVNKNVNSPYYAKTIANSFIQAQMDNDAKRQNEESCSNLPNNATVDEYGGQSGFVEIYNKPFSKVGTYKTRNGLAYAGRGRCTKSDVGVVSFDNTINHWGFDVPLAGLRFASMKGRRDLLPIQWPKVKAKKALPTETELFLSAIGRPIVAKFTGNNIKDAHGNVDVREFTFKPFTQQVNLSQADKDLHTAGFKCLYDISAGSYDQYMPIFFGYPHLAGCSQTEMDASTVYRAPTYANKKTTGLNTTILVEPVTGMFLGLETSISVYLVVDPKDYSTYHSGLCNNSAWPARTTAAGCLQPKKQIVPWFWFSQKAEVPQHLSILMGGAFMAIRAIIGYPLYIQIGGAVLLVLSFIMCFFASKSGGSSKVSA